MAAVRTSTGPLLAVVPQGDPASTATVWSWDGAAWTPAFAGSVPIDPLSATMTGDPATGACLLVQRLLPDGGGGSALLRPGAGAQELGRAGQPPVDTSRRATQPVDDAALGRVVLLGGDAEDFTQAWMWTGVAWVALEGAPAPPLAAPGPHPLGR
jgi:hypothetical protein